MRSRRRAPRTVHPVSISCLPAHPEAWDPWSGSPNSTQHDCKTILASSTTKSVDQPAQTVAIGAGRIESVLSGLLRHTRLDVLIGGAHVPPQKVGREHRVWIAGSADLRRIGGRRRRPRRVGVALHVAPRTRRSGYLARRRSVVGFNRLSIIDIEHSHQPLRWGPAEAPDRYALVFNGEIYNYVELREQLIAEFDARCAPRVTRRPSSRPSTTGAPRRWSGCAACSPSPSGIRRRETSSSPAIRSASKPLFLTTGPGHGLWQREEEHPGPPRRLGLDAELDHRALEHYIELQYVPEPETLHRSIGRLESGCYATLSPVSRRPSPATSIRASTCDRSPPTPASRESTRSPRSCATRSPSTCVPTSPSARSSPAESIRRWSPPWPASTTRPSSITTGFARDGYLRSTSPPKPPRRSGCATRSRSSPQEFIDAIPEIVVPRRPGRRSGSGPLYFLAKEARKHVRSCSPARAPMSCSAATPSTEPLSLAAFDKLPGKSARRAAGRLSDRIPEGTRGKEPAAPRFDVARGALLRQRPQLRRCPAAASAAGLPPGVDPHRCHRPIYAESVEWDPVARMQHLDLFTWFAR